MTLRLTDTVRASRRSTVQTTVVQTASVSLAAALAVVALSGCSASGSGYADLDRQAEPADELSVELPAYALKGIDTESARFVGEHNETALWLLTGEKEQVCLLAYAAPSNWVMGCGDAKGVALGGTAGHFEAVPDGSPAPSNATSISENVYAFG